MSRRWRWFAAGLLAAAVVSVALRSALLALAVVLGFWAGRIWEAAGGGER